RLRRGAHKGADTAEEEKIDRRLQYGPDYVIRRCLFSCETQRGACLGRERDLLRRAGEHAASSGDEATIVVLPARARQTEQAPTLAVACFRIWRRVDENVAMIESGNELDGWRPHHGIAEHVARHIAHADDRERRLGNFDIHLTKVTLDRFPGAARGDAHLLV